MSNNFEKLDILSIHDILAKETNHKLIVQTALGQYMGKLYDPKDKEYEYVSAITKQIETLRYSKFDEKNPTAFFMVDVELHTSALGGSFKMPYVCLFLDQILGISMGSYNHPDEE